MSMTVRTVGLVVLALLVAAAGGISQGRGEEASAMVADFTGRGDVAVLGGGCFWCLEAVYERIDGVKSVVSGYAGGATVDPTYQEVSAGTTGHAEVVRIEFDPGNIAYGEILELFWTAHDPTTLNRQGADVGTQYRSIVLYTTEAQGEATRESLRIVAASGKFDGPIVTQIEPLEVFYPAEDDHQDYYERNPTAGYCSFVISPKLKKLGLE